MKDALFILGVFGSLLAPSIMAEEWWWTGFFATMLGVLGLFELGSVANTGDTLSQQFGKMKTKWKVAFSGGFGVFFVGLLWHLWSM